jgi:hypothetical protein
MSREGTSSAKGREWVHRLRVDLCPVREPVPQGKGNRLIGWGLIYGP